MSNYTKATNFTAKDSLTTGDPSKKVLGSEIDTEFSAIETAIATKADTASPTFTGTVTLPTVAGNRTDSGNITHTGTVTMSSKSMYWAKGADIASANPLVVGTDGNYFDVTGTTGFASMTVTSGLLFMLQFDDALTLTHHATNLNLPGGADITTAAGDRMICFATGSNTVHVIEYIRAASGFAPDYPPGMKKLTSGSVSGAATMPIVLTSYTGYKNKLVIVRAIPSTDDVDLLLRLSTDGGSNYDSGATNYSFAVNSNDSATGDVSTASDATYIPIGNPTTQVGNGAAEGIIAYVEFNDMSNTAYWPQVNYRGSYVTSAATPSFTRFSGGGVRRAAQDTDAIQFSFGTGNITGTYEVYGWN